MVQKNEMRSPKLKYKGGIPASNCGRACVRACALGLLQVRTSALSLIGCTRVESKGKKAAKSGKAEKKQLLGPEVALIPIRMLYNAIPPAAQP